MTGKGILAKVNDQMVPHMTTANNNTDLHHPVLSPASPLHGDQIIMSGYLRKKSANREVFLLTLLCCLIIATLSPSYKLFTRHHSMS